MCRRAPPGISSENNILMYIRRLPPHRPDPPRCRLPSLSLSLSSLSAALLTSLTLSLSSFCFSHSLSLCLQPLLLCQPSSLFCLPISFPLSVFASLHFFLLPLSLVCLLSLIPPHRFVLGAFFDVSLSYVRARVCCAGIVHVRPCSRSCERARDVHTL